MKISSIVVLIGILFFSSFAISQTASDNGKTVGIPNVMFDVSYSNKFLFLNNDSKTQYNNGDIVLKLNNDIEINALGLFVRNFNSKRHKLYGGAGINFSEYLIKRNIYSEPQSYSGHFAPIYSYSPDKLEYKLQLLRFQLQTCHYAFYKRVIVFQKIGLAYTVFLKNANSSAKYEEKYGNSIPTQDPAYITPSNPEGWYLKDIYTYTNKNDLDIYKNGFNAFCKFGMGIKIKQFTPFAAFEFSNVTGKFWSPYIKFQIGINYSFLK